MLLFYIRFGRSFLSNLLDIPYPIFSTRLDFSHRGMTVIEFPNQEGIVYPQVLQLSNDSHLYREGLPTNYSNRLRFDFPKKETREWVNAFCI